MEILYFIFFAFGLIFGVDIKNRNICKFGKTV